MGRKSANRLIFLILHSKFPSVSNLVLSYFRWHHYILDVIWTVKQFSLAEYVVAIDVLDW